MVNASLNEVTEASSPQDFLEVFMWVGDLSEQGLSTHLSMDIQVASTSWLLEIALQWTLGCTFVCFWGFLVYFWLLRVFIAVARASLVETGGAPPQCGVRASPCSGFSCCGARAGASGAVRTGLVPPRHVESSWTGNRTCVPYVGRLTLNG